MGTRTQQTLKNLNDLESWLMEAARNDFDGSERIHSFREAVLNCVTILNHVKSLYEHDPNEWSDEAPDGIYFEEGDVSKPLYWQKEEKVEVREKLATEQKSDGYSISETQTVGDYMISLTVIAKTDLQAVWMFEKIAHRLTPNKTVADFEGCPSQSD